MQRLEASGAVRPLKWPLGVKWLIFMYSTRYSRQILMKIEFFYFGKKTQHIKFHGNPSSGS
jgi:hypothetical protein